MQMEIPRFLQRLLCILFLSLLLSACDQAKQEMEDYTARMRNLLDAPITIPSTTSLPAFPDQKQLKQEVDEIREGLLDVLDFKQCDLLYLIAERNSILGKVMPNSQRIVYEFRLLTQLDRCANKLENATETDLETFRLRLDALRKIKRDQLPYVVWNAIYASEEMRGHFAPAKHWLDSAELQNSNQYTELFAALEHFIALASLSHAPSVDRLPPWLDEIEKDYFALYQSQLGAQLLRTLKELTPMLNAITQAMQTRIHEKPLCDARLKTQKKTILQNIFLKFYVTGIQHYIARVDQLAQNWFSAQQTLLMEFSKGNRENTAMVNYHWPIFAQANNESLLAQWKRSHEAHTKAWQDLLKQCALSTQDLARQKREENKR